MQRYRCTKDNIITQTSVCPVCKERAELEKSDIYWCDTCNIPLYQKKCSCGSKPRRMVSDIRPVFPEERLLLEILLKKPFAFLKDSVWNGSGNKYYVNGKRIDFSVKDLIEVDAEEVRKQYEDLREQNTYQYFDSYIKRFLEENRERYEEITTEATGYIRESTKNYKIQDMFVSFSGGKDSTVVSSLVMRALSEPKILHIFGDTTLEFPETMHYVERFKKEHPKTPVLSSRNKEKNFEELCELMGPPSRVMRWCCTIFKTGAIQRKIKALFGDKDKIITFYGIRRSESASRSKYERETEGSKITKQITISPIIDWMDFDIWLYLLTTKTDFNDAYRWGYTRVGCWCCPNNSIWSEFLSMIHMPDQYFTFREQLIDFAKKVGKKDPEVYVDTGKWKARQGGNGLMIAQTSVVTDKPCVTQENAFNYELTRPLSDELYELMKPFGHLDFSMGRKRLHEVYVVDSNYNSILRIHGKAGSTSIKIIIDDIARMRAKDLADAKRKIDCQITKYQMCLGCRACESVCKYSAISVSDKEGSTNYKIDDTKCVKCQECVGHFTLGCYMRKVLAIKRN